MVTVSSLKISAVSCVVSPSLNVTVHENVVPTSLDAGSSHCAVAVNPGLSSSAFSTASSSAALLKSVALALQEARAATTVRAESSFSWRERIADFGYLVSLRAKSDLSSRQSRATPNKRSLCVRHGVTGSRCWPSVACRRYVRHHRNRQSSTNSRDADGRANPQWPRRSTCCTSLRTGSRSSGWCSELDA